MVSRTETWRRKEVLREAGVTRTPQTFSRVGGPVYRIAHACFGCRRTFKIARDLNETPPVARCPGCGEGLKFMGRTFRTPKAADVAQWRKVEALWNAGFRFVSYRSHPDAERLPETLGEVADFIARNPDHPFRIADPAV